ncbi:MAG TPA: ATP-binding protein, partial [Planctomycetia bacterium]|nr:ATP-binding protein [Planctomycetia bacterium]
PVVLLLTDCAEHRAAVTEALADIAVRVVAARPPFDAGMIADAACILLDDRIAAAAGPLLETWRRESELDRPPLFALLPSGVPPILAADVLQEIDGVLVPQLGAGMVRRVVVTALENRRLHAELEEQGRFAGLGKVLAGVLHELKNPLNNILGGIDRLDALLAGNEQADRWRQMVRRNGELVRESLHELLNGFRANLAAQSAPLYPILDRALVYAVSGDINYRGAISVEKEYSAPDPLVSGNPGQILHLFVNLIVNARQALGEKSGLVAVRTKWEGERIAVEVRDSGPGIAPEVLPHLFRTRRTTKRVGTGIGLAFAREVVDRHGGEIEAENLSGGGACFRVRLPAQAR